MEGGAYGGGGALGVGQVGEGQWGSGAGREGGPHFCPVMDCDMERGGIMSNRYSRCRSAKLELLWAPTAAGFR